MSPLLSPLKASESTACCTPAFRLEPGDLASSVSTVHEAAVAWLVEKKLTDSLAKVTSTWLLNAIY